LHLAVAHICQPPGQGHGCRAMGKQSQGCHTMKMHFSLLINVRRSISTVPRRFLPHPAPKLITRIGFRNIQSFPLPRFASRGSMAAGRGNMFRCVDAGFPSSCLCRNHQRSFGPCQCPVRTCPNGARQMGRGIWPISQTDTEAHATEKCPPWPEFRRSPSLHGILTRRPGRPGWVGRQTAAFQSSHPDELSDSSESAKRLNNT
jgi:hypothetical protein